MPLLKTYFILPSTDYAPDKLIKLGQIISDPSVPFRALSPPHETLPEIQTASKFDWSFEKSKDISSSVGVFSQVLAVLNTIRGNFSAKFSSHISGTWKSAELFTQFIEPDDDYVTASVQGDATKAVLRGMMAKPVYMITGVKIAREASASSNTSREAGVDANLALDGTALSVPVQVGPKFSISQTNKDVEAFGASSSFVLAYRVRKIFVRVWSDKVYSKQVGGGELAAHGEDIWDDDCSEDSSNEESVEKGPPKDSDDRISATADLDDFGSRVLPPGFKMVKAKDEADDEECQFMCLIDTSPSWN